jgi:chromosome segregation ATPase
MFETFRKTRPGGKGGNPRHPAEELMALLEAARKERIELTAVLTQIETRGAKVTQVGHALEQIEKKAAAAADRLGSLDSRLAGLDERTRAAEDLTKRLDTLSERTAKAEGLMGQITSSTGELTKHREMLQTFSSQALQTQAGVETLKKERIALENMRSEMRHVQADVKQSIDQMAAVKTDLDEMRTGGGQLAQDYARLKDA